MPKRSLGLIWNALPLVYGIVPVLVGAAVLRRSQSESASLVAFGALFFLGGTIMMSSALWSLVDSERSLPLLTCGVTSILSAALFAWATLSDVLPCSGPD
jgi:hypothetical protein